MADGTENGKYTHVIWYSAGWVYSPHARHTGRFLVSPINTVIFKEADNDIFANCTWCFVNVFGPSPSGHISGFVFAKVLRNANFPSVLVLIERLNRLLGDLCYTLEDRHDAAMFWIRQTNGREFPRGCGRRRGSMDTYAQRYLRRTCPEGMGMPPPGMEVPQG